MRDGEVRQQRVLFVDHGVRVDVLCTKETFLLFQWLFCCLWFEGGDTFPSQCCCTEGPTWFAPRRGGGCPAPEEDPLQRVNQSQDTVSRQLAEEKWRRFLHRFEELRGKSPGLNGSRNPMGGRAHGACVCVHVCICVHVCVYVCTCVWYGMCSCMCLWGVSVVVHCPPMVRPLPHQAFLFNSTSAD